MRAVVGWLRLAGVLIGLLLMVAALAPLQMLILKIAPARRHALPSCFHRAILSMLRIRTLVHGAPALGGVLHVANHTSWTDIPLLGAELDSAFVAKAEVSRWPLLGALARLDGVMFVDRERIQQTGGQAATIADRLHRGDGVILFPEGTTSDGQTMLPFKTSLFAAAAASEDIIVQPVSLAYTRIADRPASAADRRRIAWTGDESLLPHALRLLGDPPLTAEVVFHPPVRRTEFPDRKALAQYCQETIAAGLDQLLSDQAAKRSV